MTRFLGFVAGVAVTLAVVQRTGVPGLADLPLSVADVRHRIQAVLADEAGGEARGPDPLPSRAQRADPSDPVPVLPEPEPESASATEGHKPAAAIETPEGDPDTSTEHSRAMSGDPPPGVAEFSEPRSSDDEPTRSPTERDSVLPDPGPAASHAANIWAPFRSERSAEGFAAHLRERFDMRFEVRRAAPGIYQVFLMAESESRLAEDLDRLRGAGPLARLEDKQ
jgi:hypothetical protein